jgi:hypothetical protein
LFNSEYFCDALEKCVNGQEKRSVELVFKTFYENCLHNVKLNEKENILRDIQPLENAKKDFTHVMEDLINKEEINIMMLNNIKHKKMRNSEVFVNVNEVNVNHAVENMIKQTNANVINNFSNSNIARNINNEAKNNNIGIKLTKINDFQSEKRMMVETENKLDKFSLNNSMNNIYTDNNMINKQQKYSRSILDFIGKKGSASGTSSPKSGISQNEGSENFKILIEDRKLEKIKESDEDDFNSNKFMIEKSDNQRNNKNIPSLAETNNRKRKGFMIQDKNIAKKKK